MARACFRPVAALACRRMDTAALAHLDRTHLWHPFTQQRGWERGGAGHDRARRGLARSTTPTATRTSTACPRCGAPSTATATRSSTPRCARSSTASRTRRCSASRIPARREARGAARGDRAARASSASSTPTTARPPPRWRVKMAYQYWQQRGRDAADRVRLPARRLPRRHDRLGLGRRHRPLPRDVPPAAVRRAPRRARATPPTCGGCSRSTATRVAAVIVEPLVQGAAGMIVHPEGYLRAVRELCDEHGVLLICDEVAVGFGRTGTMFACEQEDVAPDLMCVAKGITGGYLPLAATLTTEAIYAGVPRRAPGVPDVLPRPHVHGQPAGLRGGARDARRLRVRAHARAARRRRSSCCGELLDELVAPLPTVAEIRRRGFMTGIELTPFPAAGAHGPSGDARGAARAARSSGRSATSSC